MKNLIERQKREEEERLSKVYKNEYYDMLSTEDCFSDFSDDFLEKRRARSRVNSTLIVDED
jgi:hypothetical protein